MNQEELAVWQIIETHRGKAQAISYGRLAWVTGLPERKVRQIVHDLILAHRKPICASYDHKCGGYYMPQTAAEIRETVEKLRKHGISILSHAAALSKMSLPKYLGQLSLQF